MAQGDFWSDQDRANRTIQTLKGLKVQRDPVEQFQRGLHDATELLTLVEPDDHASLEHLTKDITHLEVQLNQLEIQRLLGDPLERQDPPNWASI